LRRGLKEVWGEGAGGRGEDEASGVEECRHTASVRLSGYVMRAYIKDGDFWRACNSLQLDETVAIHTSRLSGDPSYVSLDNNKHPPIPLSILQAAYRLLVHGLAAECLHATQVHFKRQQMPGADA